MTSTCALCKSPATGLASIDDERFCHGDDDPTPTCYERAQWRRFGKAAGLSDVELAILRDDESAPFAHFTPTHPRPNRSDA